MASIDERVVSMAFENARFEAGVSQTLNSLHKLNDTLGKVGTTTSFGDIDKAANKVTLDTPMTALDRLKAKLGRVGDGASDGFNEISRGANRVDLAGLTASLDGITSKFSVLEGAAAVALGNIASKAVTAGLSFAKSFTIGPIQQGFQEYSTNLNSIQTILANTASSGGTLKKVNAALDELNTYSDQTIYNFSEMAKNIGTFTAAGVNLGTATKSIKGIANLAALSGSNSQQASTAMYQLSQAIAAGKVNLQDWNSVVNAGMGGQVFQKALWDTGKAMGTITNVPVGQTFEEWKKAGNSFRESLSATQKAANAGKEALVKAQEEGRKSVSDAQTALSDAVSSSAKRVKDAQDSAAEATKNAAQRVSEAQKTAAEDAKSSAEAVTSAQRAVADTAKQSKANILEAQDAQHAAFKQAAEDVKSALDDVTAARKRLEDALKPPSQDELQAATDKLKTAQLDQADLSGAITEAQRDQQRSSEDLAAAQKRLSELQGKNASADEILSATRAVEDAQKKVTDSADAVERAILRQNAATRGLHEAQKDLQDIQKKGTENDQNVVDSRDALTKATQRYADIQVQARKDELAATENLAAVRKKSVEDQKKAAKDLAEAEQKRAETLKKGRDDITTAEKEQAKVLIDSREQVAEAEKEQAKTIADARERVADAISTSSERIQQAKDAIAGGKEPPSWLTTDVLTTTLKQFSGDITDAELKSKGFTDAQIKEIRKTAKIAKESATQVKTFPQAIGVAIEAIGSGWATTFRTIFGTFDEAKKTFTGISNAVGDFITVSSTARNKVLADWKSLGGRTQLIAGLEAAWDALASVLKPIGEAFRDIFPRQTGQQLYNITVQFQNLMSSLKPGSEVIDGIHRTFRGLFAVLHIGVSIVKGIALVIGELLGMVGEGSGGFLNLTGSIGDFLVSVDEALTKGGALTGFFQGLANVLKIPLKIILGVTQGISQLFSGNEGKASDAFRSSVKGLSADLGPFAKIVNVVSDAWDRLITIFEKTKTFLTPLLTSISEHVSSFFLTIKSSFDNANWDTIFSGLQTGLIGALFVTIKKALGGGVGVDIGGGVLESLNELFGGVTKNLSAMQKNIQADTLLRIAAAIGLLAVGILVLSKIDPKALTRAMTAVSIGLGELVAASGALAKVAGGGFFFIQLPIIASGLILLSSALVVLAGAVFLFSRMKWEDLAKGLAGVGGGLAVLAAGTRLIGPSVIVSGLALIPVAIGLNLLALAVKQFAGLSWAEIGKGLVAIAGSLVLIGAAAVLAGPEMLLLGPGLIAVGFALTMISAAVKSFGGASVETLVKGILGAAAAIVVLGLAVSAIPPTVGLSAAGLIVVGVALSSITAAVAAMGALKLTSIIKGLGAIAGVLVILAVGLNAMATTLPGSVGLLAAAAALAILTPSIVVLGHLSWGTIFKGLVAIAAALATLAAVGALTAAPLALLGAALLPLAAAFTLGAGASYLFAKGLSLLATDGAKGVGVMIASITALIAVLPKMVISFLQGLVQIVKGLAEIAPQVTASLALILGQLLDVIIQQAPQIALAVGSLIDAILKILVENTPKIVEAGFQMMTSLLQGLDQNIQPVVERAASVATKFLTTLAEKAPALIEAGGHVILKIVEGVGNQFPAIAKAGGDAMLKFLTAVVGRIPEVIGAVGKMMIQFVGAITGKFIELFQAGITTIGKILEGIAQAVPRMVTEGANIAARFIKSLSAGLVRLTNVAFDAMIDFLNGFAKAIRDHDDKLRDAGWNVADAIIDGMVGGFKDLGDRAVDAIKDVIGALPKKAQKLLGIHSPSTVFATIGRQTMDGLTQGITIGGAGSETAVTKATTRLIDAAQKTLSTVPDQLGNMMDLDPVITPVLDLSSVEKSAAQLDTLTTPQITATATLSQATATSQEVSSVSKAASDAAATAGGTTFEYTQNNYSPEALSDTEIYRQTKNHLSQVKSALGV